MKTERRDVTRFCLLTTPRSGSTWFLSLLNSHPQIGAFGEAFLNKPANKSAWHNLAFLPADRFCSFRRTTRAIRPWSTFQYMDMLVEEFSARHQALGFKLMYRQLLRQPEILPKMVQDRYHIVHLVRENYLDVMISEAIMRKRGKAHSNKEVESQSVRLNPSSLVRILTAKKWRVDAARFVLRALSLPILEVSYESLLEDLEVTLQGTTDFLSVPPYTGYESDFKKISSAPDWERIENYEEVREVLASTPFASLLDMSDEAVDME